MPDGPGSSRYPCISILILRPDRYSQANLCFDRRENFASIPFLFMSTGCCGIVRISSLSLSPEPKDVNPPLSLREQDLPFVLGLDNNI
jgi:hypothetical protein